MKAILISLGIFLLAGCQQSISGTDVVIVEKGIEIPLDGCIEANTKILGKAVAPAAFCRCLIPKLYAAYKDDPEKLKRLTEGRFDQLAEGRVELVTKLYSECISQTGTNDSTARITITPKMEKRIRQGIKDAFAGTDFEKTNDLDAYCDCLINGMQTELTPGELMQADSTESARSRELREKCIVQSRKK